MRLFKLNEVIKTKVIFEIQQIDKLISQADSLLRVCKLKDPDFIEMSAMSALSFFSSSCWINSYRVYFQFF